MHALLTMLLLAGAAPSSPPALPLIGSGEYAPGVPWRVADREALLGLLRQGRYAELTRIVEGYQAAFEADPRKEYWPSTAFDAFGVPDPKILEAINGWLGHDPHSFAPYMARAAYYKALGWARRGGAYADKTSARQFQGMRDAHFAAKENLRNALKLHPQLVDAYRLLLDLGMADGASKRDLRSVLDQALALCPTCVRVRIYYMNTLEPRWGGSYAEMQTFAKASQAEAAKNPALDVLAGAVDADQCDSLRRDKPQVALAHCSAALEHRAYAPTLKLRSELYFDQGMYDDALDDANLALALQPQEPDCLEEHAYVMVALKTPERALRDLRRVEAVNPAWPLLDRMRAKLARGFVWSADQALREGQRGKQFRLLCEAKQLDPKNASIVALERDLKPRGPQAHHVKSPATLEAAVARDRELSAAHDFAAAIELWTDFLRSHPESGRAYLERAGAHMRRFDLEATRADLATACKLGEQMGCTRSSEIAVDEVPQPADPR